MNLKPATKENLKFVKGLKLKKNRVEHGEFLVEGSKSVLELLKSSFDISFLVATQAFLDENSSALDPVTAPLLVAKVSDIERSGSLKTNNSVIAAAKMPPNKPLKIDSDGYLLALDEVKDPGNLGTIIRVADWYGMSGIVLSDNCVDPFNPKTVSSSMGSFTRLQLFQTNLPSFLSQQNVSKVVTTINGKSIHENIVQAPAIIILGNESSGISKEVLVEADLEISIPKFGKAESLNVAMAASIICDNLRRH